MSDLTDTLADTPLAAEGYAFVTALSVSENVSVSDAVTFVVTPGGVILEHATASDAVATSLTHGLSVTTSAVARDSALLSMVASLSQGVTASEVWAPSYATRSVERALATDRWVTSATFALTLAQGVTATDHVEFRDAKSAVTSATATDHISVVYIAGVQIVEHVSVLDAVARTRQTFASVVDQAISHGGAAPSFIYSVRMGDLVGVFDEIDLSGTDTTWAINTRTSAVTQYANWNFNSFATFGRKYVAARRDGLYELNGPRDDPNVNIVATLGSGFTQMNAGKQAGLKGVYLGLRGQGVYQLKLVAGDGREWVYRRLSNPGLMTTKVNIGKGLHVRYLAWELTNFEGQDFDLDTVELVPMMSGRRVG